MQPITKDPPPKYISTHKQGRRTKLTQEHRRTWSCGLPPVCVNTETQCSPAECSVSCSSLSAPPESARHKVKLNILKQKQPASARTHARRHSPHDRTPVHLAAALIVPAGLSGLRLQDGHVVPLPLCEEANRRADVVNKHRSGETLASQAASSNGLNVQRGVQLT